jgi:hypothetical protein
MTCISTAWFVAILVSDAMISASVAFVAAGLFHMGERHE